MSSITFHTPKGDAEVSGAERAHMGGICGRMMDAAFGFERGAIALYDDELAGLRSMVVDDRLKNERSPHAFSESLCTSLRVGWGRRLLAWNGTTIDSFELMLNSALAMGSGPVRLAARLHGQCELHCWVDGPDRSWLADIIEDGLATGVFRKALRGHDLGWPGVVALLRASNVTPCVTSYSVCDSFPNPGLDMPPLHGWECVCGTVNMSPFKAHRGRCANCSREQKTITRDDRDNYFDSLPKLKQFERSMCALRSRSDSYLLQLRPSDFHTFRFGTGISALDLMAEDYVARLDAEYPRST